MPPPCTCGSWPPGRWRAAGLIGVTTLRRPAPVLPSPACRPWSRPVLARAAGRAHVPASPDARHPTGPPSPSRWSSASTIPTRPAGAGLGRGLLRARPGTLHVVYADHLLIDSDLSGFAQSEMEDTRDEKAAGVAEAAAEIAAAAGVPYTFERRPGSPADAILSAAASRTPQSLAALRSS